MNQAPPIPDAPGLPPWVLAYAEYEGRAVRVIDTAVLYRHCTCPPLPQSRLHVPRFLVGVGEFKPGPHGSGCPAEGMAVLPVVAERKDCAEALAVFAAHRDTLAEER